MLVEGAALNRNAKRSLLKMTIALWLDQKQRFYSISLRHLAMFAAERRISVRNKLSCSSTYCSKTCTMERLDVTACERNALARRGRKRCCFL